MDRRHELEEAVPPDGPGFVYVLSNSEIRWMVKIGCTDRHPSIRATELSHHTGIPAPFVVEAFFDVTKRRAAEARVHQELAGFRVREGREFFRVGCPRAVGLVAASLVQFRPEGARWAAPGECPACFGRIIAPTEDGLWDGHPDSDPPGGPIFSARCTNCEVRLLAPGAHGEGADGLMWHVDALR